MKITKNQLRRIIKEEVAYHSTDPGNVPRIQQDGLLTGQESAHTTGGAWADEYYGTRPIYISMQKGKYEGQPLAIDVSGLEVVADLPGLVDAGAMIEEEGLYWEEGYEPQELENLVDEDGMIYFEDLVDPSHPASQAAIELTGTAAVLENIPPDRIQLVESKKMKITKNQLRRIIKESGYNSMSSAGKALANTAKRKFAKDYPSVKIGIDTRQGWITVDGKKAVNMSSASGSPMSLEDVVDKMKQAYLGHPVQEVRKKVRRLVRESFMKKRHTAIGDIIFQIIDAAPGITGVSLVDEVGRQYEDPDNMPVMQDEIYAILDDMIDSDEVWLDEEEDEWYVYDSPEMMAAAQRRV